MSGIAFIGPVSIELLDTDVAWSGSPQPSGMRSASFGGVATWAQATQLQELVTNPARNRTVSNETGVLEYVWSGDRHLRGFNGWYLLQSVTINADVEHSAADAVVPVRVTGMAIGERQVAIARSARARTNSLGLPAYELVAAPLTVSEDSDGFAIEPGGQAVLRAFDAAHGTGFGAVGDARTMQLRRAAVGTLPSVVLPAAETDGHPPAWVAERGGDCRAFDVSEGRDVYGPSHPIAEPSDLILCNGLTRWWVGPRGLAPYLTASVIADGGWRQAGHIALADFAGDLVLEAARLVVVTPDRVTAALRVSGVGEVFVSLHRGELMVRIQHGSTRAPAVSVARRVDWSGLPPTVGGIAGATLDSSGEFGSGLAVDDGTIEFPLPRAITQTGWGFRLTWLPDEASTTQDSTGLLMFQDAEGQGVVAAWYDDADQTLHVSNGVTELQSTPVTFNAGSPVRIAASFDADRGLVLAWATPADEAGSTSAATSAWSSSTLELVTFHAYTPWGAGTWGSGEWGGHLDGGGTVDELVLFAGGLTTAQAESLVDQAAQLADLPSDPRPVWYASFDTTLEPTAATVALGRRVESSPEFHGVRRMVGALVAVTDAGLMGIQATGEQVEFMAALRTSTSVGSGNTGAEMHDQFAAHSEQETRIR